MKRFAYAIGTILVPLALSTGIAFAQSQLDPKGLEAACAVAAKAEPAAFRPGKKTKMWCAVIDREGKLLAVNATDTGGTPQNPLGSDAWRGSIEIAIAKAYTAVAFSSNDLALDSRTIGLVTRPDGPGGGPIGSDTGEAPLWGLSASNPYRSAFGFFQGSDDFPGTYHHGIITFAGGQPIYTKGPGGGCGGGGGILIGALGVSGDGVDQDDTVARNTITDAPINLCLTP
jgi:uncharacterized protein GlcG (DUF336 family)